MMMQKKLYRNTQKGVLAGLAEYFGHDVVWYRLGTLVLMLVSGFMPGVLLYLGAWIIIPAKPNIEPLDKTDYRIYS